jgi:hypothetical protein
MFIQVRAGKASLQDAGNFRAFKIVCDGAEGDLEGLRAALAGLADVDGDGHAWVAPAVLRADPAVAADAAWQQGFDAMIEKARPHGWVHPDSGAIRAHIEWANI